MHVGDVIGSGNETFDRIMKAVRKEFDFGSCDVGNFRFKGRQNSQMPNGEIVFDMEQHQRELEQIEVSKTDKTKPERLLNSKEHIQFRGSVGSLGWFVDHCCSQFSFQLAELRRKYASPKVQDLLKLNKVFRAAKVIECKIKIRSTPVEHIRFMGVNDAAHANLEGGASQQGHLILAVHASITNCRVPVSVLSWQSRKIKRVVRSSLAAETCSMSTCAMNISIGCAQCGNRWPMVILCLRITSSSSRRVPVFLSPTAKAFMMIYTKREQLQRQQTRDWQLSWP